MCVSIHTYTIFLVTMHYRCESLSKRALRARDVCIYVRVKHMKPRTDVSFLYGTLEKFYNSPKYMAVVSTSLSRFCQTSTSSFFFPYLNARRN